MNPRLDLGKGAGQTLGLGAGDEEHAGPLHRSGRALLAPGPGHARCVSREPGQGAGRASCLDRHTGLECKLDWTHWWIHGLGLGLQIWLGPSSK